MEVGWELKKPRAPRVASGVRGRGVGDSGRGLSCEYYVGLPSPFKCMLDKDLDGAHNIVT